MKYFMFLVTSLLLFATGCASVPAKQAGPQEQTISEKALDRQIDDLAEQIIADLIVQKTSRVAVIEFADLDGNVSQFGRYLAEELTTRLFRTSKFRIVERQLLNKLLEEQKLSAYGLINEQTAIKLGRMLGVDAITTGTVSDLDTRVKLHARLIGAETGSVFAAASVSVPRTKEVEILLGKKTTTGDFEVMANLDWQNTVPVRSGQNIIIAASGGWNHGEANYGSYGPEGSGKMDSGAILPGASIGTLIARINNRPPFVIGAGKTFSSEADGILQVCMNDWGFENNKGSIKVHIEVK